MRSKKRQFVILIVVLLCIVGSILIFNNHSNNKSKEESTSSDVYNEKVDSAMDSVLRAEDYNSLSLDEKKDRMLSVLYELEKDGELLNGSILYQESDKIIWFQYKDGFQGGVMLEDFSQGIAGNQDIINKYVTNWGDNGLPNVTSISSENIIYSINQEIDFSDSNYPFFESDINELDLSVKYMFGWCNSNDTSNCDYKYLNLYRKNQTIWESNHIKTDIDDYCTVEDFKTGLSGYDIVFIEEHGMILNDTPVIWTKEKYNKKMYKSDRDDIVAVKASDEEYYWVIKPSFFEKYYGNNKLNGTIIWIGSCHGYQYDGLVNAFEKCGANAVIGYNESVYIEYDRCLQNAFIYSLMYGNNVLEALEFSKRVWKPNDEQFVKSLFGELDELKSQVAQAKVNVCGENAKLIELEELRIKERQVQLKIAVMEDGDSSKLITDKTVEITVNNSNLRCKNTKATTNKEGIVMFEFNTNLQELVAKTDITLHIDGYQDFTISNYGINTKGTMINEAEAFMKPLESTEVETTEATINEITTTESSNWQQLYADELTKILHSDEYMINPAFDLYDINDDDIPELFVYLGGGFGSTSTIYTVYNNSLVEFIGSRYNEYSPSKQILYFYDLTAGSLIFSYLKLEENNLNSKLGGRSNSELNDYSINGEDVTKEIYNKYVNEFDSDDYVNIDYKYPLNEETINSELFYSNDFNIKNYERTYYPINSDFNIMVDISVQTESLTTVEIHFTNDTGTRVSENIFTGDINSNIFTFETDDGFGKNSFTLEFQDDKIILTGKCVDCYSQLWGIPEMNQIEMQSS